MVPKDLKGNLAFRIRLIRACEDPQVAHDVRQMCADDILFFINVFCLVFEPRERKVIPFISWAEFQDETILKIVESIGKKDVCIEKSRDMGASWMVLTVFFWLWLFHDYSTLGLVSRTEDAVDKSDDPDTLMWKLDFHLKQLPWFLRPGMGTGHRTYLKLKNPDNESTAVGYSATGDVARGGRKLAFMMDELAAFRSDDGYAAYSSTQHVTESRIMLSTPQGAGGIFFEVANTDSPDIEVITLHWSIHPFKSRGLYTSNKRSNKYALEILDKEYEFPEDYEFILDGKIRSPWYDRECRRSPVARLIAQELDIDYSGAGSQFFDHETLVRGEESCLGAYAVGDLDFLSSEMKPLEFIKIPGGPLKLWVDLEDGYPPKDRRYVVGCDISTGKGGSQSSNSVACVIDVMTGRKVAEYAVFGLDGSSERFARFVVTLCRWFQGTEEGAYLIWEDNGPGGVFGEFVMEIGYGNFYRRVDETLKKKKLPKPGWWSSTKNKPILLAEYGKAIQTGYYTETSLLCINEAKDYVYSAGKVCHQASLNSEDPASAGENHGDRVIATAVAWRGARERPQPALSKPEKPAKDRASDMSYAGRRNSYDKKKEKELSW